MPNFGNEFHFWRFERIGLRKININFKYTSIIDSSFRSLDGAFQVSQIAFGHGFGVDAGRVILADFFEFLQKSSVCSVS